MMVDIHCNYWAGVAGQNNGKQSPVHHGNMVVDVHCTYWTGVAGQYNNQNNQQSAIEI
jgi:hypothetical protein